MRIAFKDLFLELLKRYATIPLFLTLAIVILLAVRSLSKDFTRPHLTTTLAVGLLLCALAGAFAVAPAAWRSGSRFFQVLRATFSVPASVSGPFAVGNCKIALAPLLNADRAPGEPIALHLFYPAQAGSGQSTADQPPIANGQLDGVLRLPLTDAPYRMVLLAPGLGGTPSKMALIARNLASHGYVVAGINDPARDAPRGDVSAADEETRLRPFDFSSAEALAATFRRGKVRVDRVASRALAALDRLEVAIQSSAGLRGRIDLTRVGFVGFSFGGAAAAESTFMDPRIAAVANLDGSLFGRAAQAPVNVPYLWLHSDFSRQVLFDPSSPRRYEYRLDQNDLRLVEVQSIRPDSHLFIIRGSFHESFVDPSPGLKSLFKWLLLDPYRAHEIIDAYLIGFLDTYLKGDRRNLLGANNPRYPEVQILNSPN
jgi:dienelactone hydrolase